MLSSQGVPFTTTIIVAQYWKAASHDYSGPREHDKSHGNADSSFRNDACYLLGQFPVRGFVRYFHDAILTTCYFASAHSSRAAAESSLQLLPLQRTEKTKSVTNSVSCSLQSCRMPCASIPREPSNRVSGLDIVGAPLSSSQSARKTKPTRAHNLRCPQFATVETKFSNAREQIWARYLFYPCRICPTVMSAEVSR